LATGIFDGVTTVNVTIAAPVSNPFIDLNSPRDGDVTTSSFEVGGWALDAERPPARASTRCTSTCSRTTARRLVYSSGRPATVLSRPDVAAIFGARFSDTGFQLHDLGPGPRAFMLGVYARSTVTGTFSIVKTIHFTVNRDGAAGVQPAGRGSRDNVPVVHRRRWSIDRAVESTSQSGPGVETLHVYIYPNPAAGKPPIFLGAAGYGYSRPDVAALYGSRYDASGFYMTVIPADFGLGQVCTTSRCTLYSTVSGFNAVAVVRVTLQIARPAKQARERSCRESGGATPSNWKN
jgi:hypothetical protein